MQPKLLPEQQFSFPGNIFKRNVRHHAFGSVMLSDMRSTTSEVEFKTSVMCSLSAIPQSAGPLNSVAIVSEILLEL